MKLTPTEAAAKALKECELDCCDWDMDILREAAGIAITGVLKAGYVIIKEKEYEQINN